VPVPRQGRDLALDYVLMLGGPPGVKAEPDDPPLRRGRDSGSETSSRHGPIPQTRLIRRPRGMAADHGHPQPAETLQGRDGANAVLTGVAGAAETGARSTACVHAKTPTPALAEHLCDSLTRKQQ
jgi:hypothetical protein